MRLLLLPALLVGVLMATPAGAVRPDEMLADPALEARARTLSAELRCLVCQNQSIDESDADLAHDLRVVLRERLVAGDTDGEALDFLVARYGQYVLLKPRFNADTLVLWLAPPALLLFGGALAFAVVRRRRPAAGTAETLTADEEARLDKLLAAGDRK